MKELKFETDNWPSGILPKPVGYRLLIAPVTVEDESTGGILIPEQAKKVLECFRTVGKVVAIGEDAYQHVKFNGKRWVEVGDVVQYNCYEGHEMAVAYGDEVCKLRLVNDDSIFTKVDNPEVLNFL